MFDEWFLHYVTRCTAVFAQPRFDNRLRNVNKHVNGLMTGWMFRCKNYTHTEFLPPLTCTLQPGLHFLKRVYSKFVQPVV
jgi:hypothetical protein